MNSRLLRRLAAAFLAAAMLSTFPACNTVSGLGEDLQILGEKMERKADQVNRGESY